MIDKFWSDAIKKRVPSTLLILAFTGILFFVFWYLKWLPQGGKSFAYEFFSVTTLFLLVTFSLLYLVMGLSGGLQIVGILAGIFLCAALFKTLGLIVGFFLYVAYGRVKRIYYDRKAKRDLLSEYAGLDEKEASEIVQSLNSVETNINDIAGSFAREFLDQRIIMVSIGKGKNKRYGMLFVGRESLALYPVSSEEDLGEFEQQESGQLRPAAEALMHFQNIDQIVIGRKRLNVFTVTVMAQSQNTTFKCEGLYDGYDLKELLSSLDTDVILAPGLKLKSPMSHAPDVGKMTDEIRSLAPDQLDKRKKARIYAKILNGAGLIFALGVLLLNFHIRLLMVCTAICLILPLLGAALYARYADFLRMDSNKEGKPNLAGVMLIPPICSCILPAVYAEAVGFNGSMWIAMIAGAVIGAAVCMFLLLPRLNEGYGTQIILFIFGILYGAGFACNIMIFLRILWRLYF